MKIDISSDKVFFSSDFHLDHSNMAGPKVSKWPKGYRDFDSLREMNTKILQELNDQVPHDGVLFFLGDLCFGRTNKAGVKYWRDQINCSNVYWVLGNHDKITSASRFEYIGDYLSGYVNGQYIVMTHYPLLSWHWAYRLSSWNLHGHCHAAPEIQKANASVRRLDVGIDSYKEHYGDYGIFSFEQIKEIMDSKKLK